MNPTCMSKHPSLNNTWCMRRTDHDGRHRDVGSGVEWGSPAGSYTRTVEDGTPDCEAEHDGYLCSRELGHDGPHIAATAVLNNSVGAVWGDDSDEWGKATPGQGAAEWWHKRWEEENARVEKAEWDRDDWKRRAGTSAATSSRLLRERDEAEQALVEMTAHRDQCRDTAIKWQTEANRADEQLRPLDLFEKHRTLWGIREARREFLEQGLTYKDVRRIVELTFTPEPDLTRPEGAQAVSSVLGALREDDGEWMTYASDEDLDGLADALAERGVRVTSVGLTPTNPKTED